MTTTTAPATAPARPARVWDLGLRRTGALARAEWNQFRRNTTLFVLGSVFPLGCAVGYFQALRQAGVEVAAATAAGAFVVLALLLVPFYSVVSMATTRRDEGVLKRLRTGEARDAEILVALGVPGAVLAVALLPVFVAVLLAMGAPAPASAPLMAATLLIGLPVAVALALITSGWTRDAEAAQISSLPVTALAMVSTSTLRGLLPDRLAEVIDRTPFALMDDLAWLAWTGRTSSEAVAGAPAATGWELMEQARPMLGMLLLWGVALTALVPRVMRWQTHR